MAHTDIPSSLRRRATSNLHIPHSNHPTVLLRRRAIIRLHSTTLPTASLPRRRADTTAHLRRNLHTARPPHSLRTANLRLATLHTDTHPPDNRTAMPLRRTSRPSARRASLHQAHTALPHR